ncbi:MAG: hypothetical protein PVJ61_01055 [Dehalococcoidia bacterium]|jgi:hypothetical protein
MRFTIPIALVGLLTLGIMLPGCSAEEAAEAPPNPSSPSGDFYGVCPELEAELEQIVLADPKVQALLEGKDYSFTVDGHTVENQDFNLAVGVRLKDEMTPGEFSAWLDGGRQDSSLIEEYLGVLNIGYGDKYYLTIDREENLVAEMTYEAGQAGIPEATPEDKERAVAIALADPTVQQLLAGKEYEIAPDDKIGVWHSGSTKLGMAFEIEFAEIYVIDMELPRYQSEPQHVSGEVEGVLISVLLEENRVAKITPIAPMPAE